MQYEVKMIHTLMYGIWDNTNNVWYEDKNGLIIHSPSKEFLEKSYMVNLAALAP